MLVPMCDCASMKVLRASRLMYLRVPMATMGHLAVVYDLVHHRVRDAEVSRRILDQKQD